MWAKYVCAKQIRYNWMFLHVCFRGIFCVCCHNTVQTLRHRHHLFWSPWSLLETLQLPVKNIQSWSPEKLPEVTVAFLKSDQILTKKTMEISSGVLKNMKGWVSTWGQSFVSLVGGHNRRLCGGHTRELMFNTCNDNVEMCPKTWLQWKRWLNESKIMQTPFQENRKHLNSSSLIVTYIIQSSGTLEMFSFLSIWNLWKEPQEITKLIHVFR